MDIELCRTDDDYEQWRAVRLAVLPYERCITVAQLRDASAPDRLMVLARIDGTVVGHGLAGRSESFDSGFIAPRVLQGHRRHGMGTVLLHHLVDHLTDLGLPRRGARLHLDPGRQCVHADAQ